MGSHDRAQPGGKMATGISVVCLSCCRLSLCASVNKHLSVPHSRRNRQADRLSPATQKDEIQGRGRDGEATGQAETNPQRSLSWPQALVRKDPKIQLRDPQQRRPYIPKKKHTAALRNRSAISNPDTKIGGWEIARGPVGWRPHTVVRRAGRP